MDKLILIESNNSFLINKKLNDLNKDNYIIEYKDLSDINIDDVIVDLDTYNFINPNRIVVCTNTNNMFKSDSDKFEKYIENPNPDNILVLVTDTLDNRKKISKKINKLFKKVEVEINPNTFIKDNLEDYKMDNIAIMELISITNSDVIAINNELQKLKMYKLEEKVITKEDIKEICYRHINDSDDYIFSFVDAILNKDKKKALAIYNDLKELSVEPLSLIGLIASQVRSMLQVKLLSNIPSKDIADKLKMHPYRVQKIIEKNNNYQKEDLIKLVKNLYQTDFSIKSGNIDSYLAVLLLILDN